MKRNTCQLIHLPGTGDLCGASILDRTSKIGDFLLGREGGEGEG